MSYKSTNDCISFSTRGTLEKCVNFFENNVHKSEGKLYGIIIDAIGEGSVVLNLYTNFESIGGGPIVHVTYFKKDGSTFYLFIEWKSDHWDVENRSADSLMSYMRSYGRSVDGLPTIDEDRKPYSDDGQ